MSRIGEFSNMGKTVGTASINKWSTRLAWVCLGVFLTFSIIVFNKPDAQKLAESEAVLEDFKRLNIELAKCFPDDLGEVSILNLADQDGILKLHCEKHAIDGGKLSLAINVPVSVD